MTITVKKPAGAYDISVIVDGYCNHYSREAEVVEEEYPGENDEPDRFDKQEIEQCTKCFAWRYLGEIDWNGVEEMPMI